MGRMLQALRQIESRSSGAVSTSRPGAVEPTPSVDDLMDSAQQMWQQVEAALAADQATSPGAMPPGAVLPGATGVSPGAVLPGATGVSPVPPSVPPAETATTTATASTADPYGLLAATVLGQLPSTDPAALMFTSADDDEGKTDVLARLAAALAQRVQGNVLVIDGNSRARHWRHAWGCTLPPACRRCSPARPRGTTWSGQRPCVG